MTRPKKLSFLLCFWFVYGFLLVIVSTYGFFSLFRLFILNGLVQRYPANAIIQILAVILLLIYSVYLLKVSFNLWRGRDSSFGLKIISTLSLLNIPLGTALGIATFIILNSREAKNYLRK